MGISGPLLHKTMKTGSNNNCCKGCILFVHSHLRPTMMNIKSNQQIAIDAYMHVFHFVAICVLSCLCDNACKRSLAICRKNRASCPVSRLLSVPIWPTCAENMIQTNKQTNKLTNLFHFVMLNSQITPDLMKLGVASHFADSYMGP